MEGKTPVTMATGASGTRRRAPGAAERSTDQYSVQEYHLPPMCS